MKSRTLQMVSLCVLATFCWSAAAFGGTPSPGRNVVPIRGAGQEIYYVPARGTPLNETVLFVPGVGGWRGWAVTIAETMASWGYDVFGVDTKTYLDGFSGSGTLTEAEVTNDMCELADWAANGSGKRVTFVGWSEGAGLGVLGAAGVASKKTFAGVITFGLTDENVIAWHWSENLMSLIRKPQEPTFRAVEYMVKVAPLPLWMIQSSHDQYVGLDEAKRLFAAAHEPKRFELVQASNHRFDGNHQEFFLELRNGLQWVSRASQTSTHTVK